MRAQPLRLRPGRKFPPRMQKEEFHDRVQEVMHKCGVYHHTQADFESQTARVAIGSTEWSLHARQPTLKLYDNKPWACGYSVAVAFLKQFSMDITLDTLSIEAESRSLPEFDTFLVDGTVTDTLSHLLDFSRPRSFDAAVNDFSAPSDDISPPAPATRNSFESDSDTDDQAPLATPSPAAKGSSDSSGDRPSDARKSFSFEVDDQAPPATLSPAAKGSSDSEGGQSDDSDRHSQQPQTPTRTPRGSEIEDDGPDWDEDFDDEKSGEPP
jgi:hypothetical protein